MCEEVCVEGHGRTDSASGGLAWDVSGFPSPQGRAGPVEHHQQTGRFTFPPGPPVQYGLCTLTPGWLALVPRALLAGWCKRRAEGRTRTQGVIATASDFTLNTKKKKSTNKKLCCIVMSFKQSFAFINLFS